MIQNKGSYFQLWHRKVHVYTQTHGKLLYIDKEEIIFYL